MKTYFVLLITSLGICTLGHADITANISIENSLDANSWPNLQAVIEECDVKMDEADLVKYNFVNGSFSIDESGRAKVNRSKTWITGSEVKTDSWVKGASFIFMFPDNKSFMTQRAKITRIKIGEYDVPIQNGSFRVQESDNDAGNGQWSFSNVFVCFSEAVHAGSLSIEAEVSGSTWAKGADWYRKLNDADNYGSRVRLHIPFGYAPVAEVVPAPVRILE